MAAASPPPISHFSLLPWIIFLLPLSRAIAYNVTLGSSISSLRENPSWPSPSGEFAFGLYRLKQRKNLFIPAVWIDKIPERTVVWYAQGGDPVERGSSIELTATGQLVLFDHLNQTKRLSNITGPIASAASAAMLDSGEFVLRGPNASRIWGTFDSPTDTLLPTQKLRQNNSLFARHTDDDFSTGRFQLSLQSNDLALYTVNFPTRAIYNTSIGVNYNVLTGFVYNIHSPFLYNGDFVGSRSLGKGDQLSLDESGNLVMLQKNGTASNLTATRGGSFPTGDFYHRATIDPDGVFRHYVYRKTGRSARWSAVELIPSDICTTLISYPGSGICGFNSYCKLDPDRNPRCECPTGYSYSLPGSPMEGCRPNFTLESCFPNTTLQYEMVEILNTTWIVADFEQNSPVGEDFCKSSCLDDCLCAVAIFDNGTCLKKRLPLSNGRSGPGIRAKALIKVPRRNPSAGDLLPPDSCSGRRKGQTTLVRIVASLLGGSGFLNLLLLSAISLAFYHSYHKKLFAEFDQKAVGAGLLQLNLRSFTYKELEEATNGFKEVLGKGGFGSVYKGIVRQDSSVANVIVAVKRLDRVVQEGEREFEMEVSVIGQSHHKNLVRLLGFCDEADHRLLVYEFLSNGSLAGLLFDGNGGDRPDWAHRCQIAVGIARGLAYLHEGCATQIIHCDIKPQNILLDDSLAARISDFGMAKLLRTDECRTSTVVRGTRGYLAPEWFRNLPVTVKVDVYSFGIVLLEIICCRRHVEVTVGREEEVILKDWAYRCYREGRLDLLVAEDGGAAGIERMLMVALWCVQDDPSVRPSMKRVVRMLTGVVDVYAPSDPCFLSHVD